MVLHEELAIQVHRVWSGIRGRWTAVYLPLVISSVQQCFDLGNMCRTEDVLLHIGHFGKATHFTLVNRRGCGCCIRLGVNLVSMMLVLQIGRWITTGVHAADNALVVRVPTVPTLLVLGSRILEPNLYSERQNI